MKHLRTWLLAVLGCLIAPVALAQQFSVAVFSKTAGWHHESINEGVTAIRELGKLHHFEVFWTEDPNRLFKDEELSKHAAVVFLLTTGDALNDEQQATFERYIRQRPWLRRRAQRRRHRVSMALVHEDARPHVPSPSRDPDRDGQCREPRLPRHGTLRASASSPPRNGMSSTPRARPR